MNDKFRKWFEGDTDVFENILDAAQVHDPGRDELKSRQKLLHQRALRQKGTSRIIDVENRSFRILYNIIAVVCCIGLISVLLYIVANLPLYGHENPRTMEVVTRYVEHGLEETGAVNIVAGMILDYRAFDTLGESHVLFTALVCVMILLRKDKKNMRTQYEDYYTVSQDHYYPISKDMILRNIGIVLVPCVFLFGIYVLLNGQNSPGGGFSGGAILGGAMIIFVSSFGFDKVDTFFTRRLYMRMTFISLTFYCFAKGYVFFMGANGLENHIPKGTPGAILSGGLILPLDIAVGMVVGCTMFGFYNLFRRGSIGGN